MIKGIDVKSNQTAENEGTTFTGSSHTSPKLIANSFNRQFTTSKLGKHSSSRRTRQESKYVNRMSLEEAESFTSDQFTSAIKSCRNSRAYGPDSLSIFHLKNLGPLATEHLTSLYNDSLKSRRLPFGETISNMFGCDCYFVVEWDGVVECGWRCSIGYTMYGLP